MCQQIQNSLIFFALKGEKKLIGKIKQTLTQCLKPCRYNRRNQNKFGMHNQLRPPKHQKV